MTDKKNNKKQSISQFDKKIQTLENTIEEMEKGDLPLEASIASYKKGMTLLKDCQEILTAAEADIQEIQENDPCSQ